MTSQNLNERFRSGRGYKSTKRFNEAINKYGWDNFEHIILETNLSLEDAQQKEMEYIKKFNTQDPKFGYNVAPGGDTFKGEDCPWFGTKRTEESIRKQKEHSKGRKLTEEHKRKISEANKGRVFSDETRSKMSLSRPDVSGKNNPCYGRKVPKEHINKMVKASKTPEAIAKMKAHKTWYSGKDNANAKSVICIDTGIVYDTMKQAALDTGSNASKISSVCNGHRKSTNGLHFKFYNKGEENG